MGFFKKLISQIGKEYPVVGELIESAQGGKIKQYLQDQVAEITGFGTPSGSPTYGEIMKQEKEEKEKRINERTEKLKTIYRAPEDIEMATETRRQINARIKDNLRPRNFLWGSKETLDELAEYIIDNCDKDIDELCAYLESKGVKYDRDAMQKELDAFRTASIFYLYRRSQIDELIFLDRWDTDMILERIDEDLREMEEIRNR